MRAGDKVGTITFKQRNTVVATHGPRWHARTQAAPNLLEGIGVWWDRLFRGFSGQQQVAHGHLERDPAVNDKTQAAAA